MQFAKSWPRWVKTTVSLAVALLVAIIVGNGTSWYLPNIDFFTQAGAVLVAASICGYGAFWILRGRENKNQSKILASWVFGVIGFVTGFYISGYVPVLDYAGYLGGFVGAVILGLLFGYGCLKLLRVENSKAQFRSMALVAILAVVGLFAFLYFIFSVLLS